MKFKLYVFCFVLQEPRAERKPSDVMREIAINEFGALGERDSLDDLLDGTRAFFSRASTIDSFQLGPKPESGDEPESAVGSRVCLKLIPLEIHRLTSIVSYLRKQAKLFLEAIFTHQIWRTVQG